MATLHDEFAQRHPDAVVRRGGEMFVDIEAADELISEAERRGVRDLGLEGFLIAEDAVYPLLSHIADFSEVADPPQSAALARELVLGAWRTPLPRDHTSEAASGRHMLAILLES